MSHTPLARFVAGACSLTGSAAAGGVVSTTIAGLSISNPIGLTILGALATFAGGAAIYKGYKQGKADDKIDEIYTFLEQLIKQHGSLANALASLPDDLPLIHTDSCDRIRQLATIFTNSPDSIAQRIESDPDFARFINNSMPHIESMLEAHQHDLNRITQLALDNKVLNEDQLSAIDSVSESLGLLHEKADETLDINQRTERKIDQITEYFIGRLNKKENELNALQSENESLKAKVRAAINRVVEVERAAGRDPLGKLDELRKGDPHELLKFLDDQLDSDEQEFIEKHRERAAVAHVLGEIAKVIQSLSKILALLPNDLDAINTMGHVYRLRGDLPAAEKQYTRLMNLDTSKKTQAVALGNLALIEHTRGNLDAAEDYLKRSLKINESLGRPAGMANQLGNLGVIEQTRGNLDAAEEYLKLSLAINESLDRPSGMANQLGNLGVIEQTRGNLDAAEGYHKRSLEINESLGNQEGMGIDLCNLGLIERVRGNLDAAESYHKRSLTISESLGYQEGMAVNLCNLALIEHTRGNLDAAEDYHKRSLTINESIGRPVGMANDLGYLGLIEHIHGNIDAAEDYHKRSLTISESFGHSEGVAIQIGNLGLIEQTRGNLDAAEDYHKRSLTISESFGHSEGMANQLGNLGLIEQTRGNTDQTRELWTRSRDIFTQIGMPHMVEKVQNMIDRL